MGRVMTARKNKVEMCPGYTRGDRWVNEPETKADMPLIGIFLSLKKWYKH